MAPNPTNHTLPHYHNLRYDEDRTTGSFSFNALDTFALCYKQGEIRLTGWSDGSGGRLEVYLNGKWGTVSRQTDPHDNDLHLGFGKTVCYQINHYNGDDSSIFTGTVTSLNHYLQNTPGKSLIKPNASLHQVLHDL